MSIQTTTAVAPSAEKTYLALNPSVPEFQPSTAQTLYSGMAKPVLLQTAAAWTYNPSNYGTNRKLHSVMDGSSQRSYITQAARDVLYLQTADKGRLATAAFGSKRTEPRPCEMVRVEVHMKAGEPTSVDLFLVPYICEPIACKPLAECPKLFTHLTDLELSDDQTGDSREINMLFGLDFYWQFVTGEIQYHNSAPELL